MSQLIVGLPDAPVAMGNRSSADPSALPDPLPGTLSPAHEMMECETIEAVETPVATDKGATDDAITKVCTRKREQHVDTDVAQLVREMITKVVEESGFRFLVPDYPLPTVQILEDQRLVRRTGTSAPSLVFLNQAIDKDHVLSLRVVEAESCDGEAPKPFGLIIGCTSCESDAIREHERHATRYCGVEGCAGGVSLHSGLTTKVETGSLILIQKVDGDFISVTVDGKRYSITDRKKRFAGRTADRKSVV